MSLLSTVAFSNTGAATELPNWDAYIKDHRYASPGPFDTLRTPRALTLGGKKYKHTGFKLEVQEPDADSRIVIGVISSIKDVSGPTKANVKAAFDWFKAQKVEWVVANGHLALEELDLNRVPVPVFT